MKKERYNKERWAAIVMAAVLLFVCPLRAFAIESTDLPPETENGDVITEVLPTVPANEDAISIMLPTVPADEDMISEALPTVPAAEDVISIMLPTVMEEEKSPFDFIMDPQGLLYKTDAARYGGGVVEEGATLLFQNKEGEYDFSRYSDRLAVTNQSTVPVLLTISARITDLGELSMVESDDFSDRNDCCVYLAVVDDGGNVYPISADGEVTIQVEMKAAPESAYVYRLGDDLQSYHPAQSDDFEEVEFDTYFLGLVGACNPDADWSNISAHPVVSVTWHIDPIIAEPEEAPAAEGNAAPYEDETVPGDEPDIGNETVPGDELDIGNETVPGNESDIGNETAPGDESDIGNETVPGDESDTGNESIFGNDLAPGDEVVMEDEPVTEEESAIENRQEP